MSDEKTQQDYRMYHNERVYWNFEFFSKMTLAICAGLAYITINQDINTLVISKLMYLAGGIQIVIGIVCILNISSHYFRKWEKRPDAPPFWKRIWIASDLYMIIAIIFVTTAIAYITFSGYLIN